MARRKTTSSEKKFTNKTYKQKLAQFNIKPLEGYVHINEPLLHLCHCGKTFTRKPREILNTPHCGCAKRRGGGVKKTHEEYLQELKEKNNLCMPLEPYKGANTNIRHRCYCGNEDWFVRPSHVLKGRTCCGFFSPQVKDHKWYLEQLKTSKSKVKPLEPYKRFETKIWHRCICKRKWLVTPHKVLGGRLCGCERSHGERVIHSYLEDNNYSFDKEIQFDDLKYRKALRFDFGIYDEKNELLCLIEFQGRQHFIPDGRHKNSEQEFIYQQIRDDLKRKYVKKNAIPLIEITYKDSDIIKALERELHKLGIGQRFKQLVLF